jgi:hypothetical protein
MASTNKLVVGASLPILPISPISLPFPYRSDFMLHTLVLC